VIWAPWKAQAEQIIADGPMESIAVEKVAAALERLRVRA
jgi:hypothetical protein